MINSTRCAFMAKQACATFSQVVRKITPPHANNLLKFFFALFAILTLNAATAWAEESVQVTLDFTNKSNIWSLPAGSDNKTTTEKSYTNNGITIKIAGGGSGNGHYFNSDGYLMLGKSGATLTLPAFDFNTTKIVVTGKSGASGSVGQNIYVGSNAVSTATTGATGTNTYSINAANQAAGNVYILKVTTAHNTQITKIEVYGESTGTEPPTPANPYKVTLEAGPGTCVESVTEASAGAGVTLPTPTLDCGDWEFAGWTTSSIATETTSKPEILLTGTYSPSTNITLYAVYKRTETTEGGGDTSVKFTDDDSGGWTTTAGKQTGSKDGVTISTNNGIYSQNNNQLRVYKDATFTVSSTNTIISIIFSSSYYDWSAYDVGTYKNKTWTGQGNSVTFTAGNGQVRITQLVVTTSGGGSTTYYHSTPECAAPCTDAVTISKGTLSNGSFKLDKTGEQSTCNGAVTVTLSDIQPADGYKFSAITQTGVDASKVTIDNTAKTVTYAKNTTGTSTINVTFEQLPKLATPTNLKVSSVSCANASLTWDAVDGANKYNLILTNTSTATQTTSNLNTNSVSITLSAGVTYNWTIQAIGDGATNTDSEVATGADFTTHYTITYNTNGGSDVEDGCGTTLPETLPTTSKSHYTFDGWYMDEDFTTLAEASATLTKNTDLYAKWTANTYTITFNAGTGTCGTESATATNADGVSLPTATPSDACDEVGWTFAGWAEADVTETTTEPTLFAEGTNYIPAGNCTLYAVYNTTAETTGFTGYERVTEEPEDWTGKYLLSTGTYTATGAFDAIGTKGHLVRTTYSPGTDEKTEWEFTLDKVGISGYSILFPDDTWFLGYADGTNFARTIYDPSQNVAYLWTPSPEGISNVSETTRKIQDGGSDFRPYAQTATIVYLYKRIEGVVYTTVYNSNPTCTPPAEYTITWWANGEKCHTQTAVEGKAIDVPASSDVATYACDDKVFVGWVDAEISGSTNTEPTFITDFDKITENKDYFAVFATETSTGIESTIHTLTPSSSWSGYQKGTIKDDKDLTWSYCAGGQQTNGVYSLNLRNKNTEVSYIASPVFAANVKNIKATIVNGSASNTRKVYICSEPTSQPTTGDLGTTEVQGGHNGELSLSFEGTVTQFYIQVSDALQFQSIVVEVGATTTYSNYVTTCPYTITFNDWDNTELASYEVEYGQTPVYDGATPTKDADAQYTYTFSGWDKEIVSVTGDVVYTAQFDATVNKYTITFNNWDGTTLATYKVEYGQTPVYAGEAPTKAATAEHTYTFTGWTPAIVAVTGEATYTATYSQTLNQHTITATATNGTVTGAGTYDHGTSVTLTATPDFDYQFVKWSNESTENPLTITVTEDVTLEAIFKEVTATDQTLSGKFSTGKYEYAEFATGNLQYKPSTKTWRFAKQQYQVVGEQNINVGDPNFKGWIDMFSWSADGKFGVNPSNKNEDYTGEFQDWGKLFPVEDNYSTLSADQWDYLLFQRDKASSLKQIAKINGVVGILLFPDDWAGMPEGCTVDSKTETEFTDDEGTIIIENYEYTLKQWAKIEDKGAVFLPGAGRRTGGYGNKINYSQVEETNSANLNDGFYRWQDYTNYVPYYWTSTKIADNNIKYLTTYHVVSKDPIKYGASYAHVSWGEYARYGQSVRLAKVTNTLIQLGSGNNSTVITPNAGNTVNVQVNRTFKANDGYYTLCLPFALDADKIGKAYKLETITEYEADGGININLTEVEHIEAGKPYLVLPSEDLTNPIFENVTIVNTTGETIEPASVAGVKVTFTGIINGGGQTDGETEYYVGNNGYLYNKVVDIRGLCGLFTITDEADNPTQIRARVVAGENVETGVEDIITTDAPVKVIENGQLIIIRGGVKYNVQGQRL